MSKHKTKKIQDYNGTYSFLHRLVSFAVNRSYRKILHVGKENIPQDGAIIFALDEEMKANFSFNVPFCEGETQICDGVTIKIEKNPIGNKTASHHSIDVSCELISSDAHFRPRCEGDVIFAGKMNKKIKKLMSEKKVSLKERNKLPLLVSNNEILWIPSVAVCDRIKADKIKSGTDFFRITVIIENN